VIVTLAVGLAAPQAAIAADVFVGASQPGASDSGPCTDPNAPCATLQAAVDKSETQGGGQVRVLANPDGRTTDTYREAVVLDGTASVTLVGAGTRANGTRVAPEAGIPLDLGTGTSARSLRLEAPAGQTAAAAAPGSTLSNVHAEAGGGTAYAGSGRVLDSRLVGATGALLDGARLVRSEVVATVDGIAAPTATSKLLQVIVRPRATLEAPPTGDALRVGGQGAVARAELRHVTLTGYPTRVRLDGRGAKASLQAANATFADETGVDLQMHGQPARAKLRTVNRAPGRTAFSDGSRAGYISDTDPVDLLTGLTPDAKLSPSSPLVDRGTRAGIFKGDPDDATDIGGDPRLQGAAPDIGADELTPPPDGLRWVTVGTFVRPMWVASPPGDLDRLFVVERAGRVFVVEEGQVLPTPAIDLTAKVTQSSEGGLQSIAFAPDFATSGRVYGFYTRREDPATPEIEIGDIVIAEWTIDPSNPNRIDPASERRVMLLEHSAHHNHNGGTLLFQPPVGNTSDNYLWISLGDGDTLPIPSQDLARPLGKILRIDPRASGGMPYTVPPDNPYVGVAGALPEIWARGLRNPFRMGFDVLTGDLWIGDVGHHQFEEINLLRGADGRGPRANFGWRVTEGDLTWQTRQPITPANAPPDYVGPVIVRRHDEGERAITAGTVVRDPAIPALAGRFLYADFFLGVTRTAVAVPGGVTADTELEGLPAVEGVTSYSMDGCRRIYATSMFSGAVQRLTTTGQCVPPPEACTIEGTEAGERLTGTSGEDVVCGFGGRDKLFGLEGDDVLVGGAGDDELIGALGDDALQGGDGSDLADYGERTDPVTVTVGSGADDGVAGEADDVHADVERVRGGSADDRLTAGAGRARLAGGPGADVLVGSPVNDHLFGLGGADELEGLAGNDELHGDDGDDSLRALDGHRDRLVCGADLDSRQADPVDVIDPSCE